MDMEVPEQLREHVLAKITPTQDELVEQQIAIHNIEGALRTWAEEHGISYSFIEAQGSTGRKQTQLRDASDIDMFVALRPEDYEDILSLPRAQCQQQLSALFDRLVGTWFTGAARALGASNIQKTYSQHPYLSLLYEGFDVDIVGCFDIPAGQLARLGPVTAVDRTIHHTRYVVEHLDERLRDDVRLLKSFVRASHAYGDMCAVGRMGFTGYAIEVLVIARRGLTGAMRALARLSEEPVDPLGRGLAELREVPTFRDDRLFIVDPTDPRRNVASSFDPRGHRWLVHRVAHLEHLLSSSSTREAEQMFIERPIPTDPLPEWLAPHAFAREFVMTGDVHYTTLRDKLYRVSRRLEKALLRERTGEPRFGRSLTEVLIDGETLALGVIVEHPTIGATYLRKGPPLHLEAAVEEFSRRHPDCVEKDGHLYAWERREFTRAADLIDAVIAADPVRGLRLSPRAGAASARVLNVLYRFVYPVTPRPPVLPPGEMR